jgi:hypothetical protein
MLRKDQYFKRFYDVVNIICYSVFCGTEFSAFFAKKIYILAQLKENYSNG